jgi:dihydroneopterin aldolase
VTDRIVLTGIQAYAYGGVSDEEQAIGQRYEIDVELRLDLRAAGASDDLRDTVSYAQAHDIAVSALRRERFRLIETAADRVASALLTGLPVAGVTVTLRKLLPPIDGVVAAAGVEISRERDEDL